MERMDTKCSKTHSEFDPKGLIYGCSNAANHAGPRRFAVKIKDTMIEEVIELCGASDGVIDPDKPFLACCKPVNHEEDCVFTAEAKIQNPQGLPPDTTIVMKRHARVKDLTEPSRSRAITFYASPENYSFLKNAVENREISMTINEAVDQYRSPKAPPLLHFADWLEKKTGYPWLVNLLREYQKCLPGDSETRIQMEDLEMFVVFDKPTDYPNSAVVRRFSISIVTGSSPDPDPFVVADNLDEARKELNRKRKGLHCMPRNVSDESQIVETWL